LFYLEEKGTFENFPKRVLSRGKGSLNVAPGSERKRQKNTSYFWMEYAGLSFIILFPLKNKKE
jgi:hypothetical protein